MVGRIAPGARLLAPLEPFVRAQCTSAGTIATFHSAVDLVTAVAELALADGRLIVGSSANRSGTGNTYTVGEMPEEIRGGVDVTIDAGAIPRTSSRRLATTILDLTTDRFLREGMNFERIERSWQELRAGSWEPSDRSLPAQDGAR